MVFEIQQKFLKFTRIFEKVESICTRDYSVLDLQISPTNQSVRSNFIEFFWNFFLMMTSESWKLSLNLLLQTIKFFLYHRVSFSSFFFLHYREILDNGSLHFPPFSLNDYRSDIHSGIYLCSLANSVGTIISRECHLHSGLFCLQYCS